MLKEGGQWEVDEGEEGSFFRLLLLLPHPSPTVEEKEGRLQ